MSLVKSATSHSLDVSSFDIFQFQILQPLLARRYKADWPKGPHCLRVFIVVTTDVVRVGIGSLVFKASNIYELVQCWYL